MPPQDEQGVLQRELEYHERLYSGFAQRHFARPAVKRFREHSAAHILNVTGATRTTRMLSIGCGIADTELLLASRVKGLVGLDLSPAAIRQAREDAARLGLTNARFLHGTLAEVQEQFDVIIGVFFLHHLSDSALTQFPAQVKALLKPGGVFYSLDPSRDRLSGRVGRLLIPQVMKKYETEDERELSPEPTARLFRAQGFQVRSGMYDFGSTPVAGLFPGWRFGYNAARVLDDVLLKVPLLNRLGSNFEILARLA